ncbi:hypothetical protein, conserved [Eimeria maxima]|uniref:Uncharacterized protein n=1 Tax=Eimeria maxima TaxID=5804 RepID=U6MDU1_EIMMA|nr:hypothetical protein, conserved [Eimeria maxima]CDJ59845.1 hypothetical protein, conserved [Eimeria maxima]
MGTGPLVGASVAGAREEWVAQASASAIHATTKRQPWRVEWNLQLTTLLLVAALPAAFLLIRCHMQLAVSNRPINGGLRLLAEGEREGKGRTTPCRGDGLENKVTPEGAGESIEHKMKRRAENVAKKLIQVTKDCSSVAPLLPTQFPIRVVDLFLGFCIQEVAALSALLAGQFEEQKVEVLQTAESAALEVMEICWQNTTTGKRNHACRLVEYVNDLRDAGPENPPLPNEERLTMLEELLELQETAIGMIEGAISSALMSRDSSRHLTPEAAHEFAEELKRVVYTRRSQVFRSKHLSHQLRTLEAERSRGKLVPLLNLNKVDRKPKQPLETQLADLVHGSYWVKIPQNKTDKTLQETPPRDEGSPVRRQELHSMRISANTGVRAPKTSFGGSRQMYEVPPRFQVRMERAQKRQGLHGLHRSRNALPICLRFRILT